MTKRMSLNYQFWQQLESRKAIGESRHKAKIQAKERGLKVKTIHSYGTYSAYKQASKTFVKWIRNEFPEIVNLSQIDKDICAMYIKHRADTGVSAYTYSQDIAMINKCLGVGLTKSYCGVDNRSLSAITKGRIDNGFRTESGIIETIIKASGLRRNELYNLKKENLLIRDEKVIGIMVRDGAKGGRPRTIEVITKHQESFYNIVRDLDNKSRVISEVIPKQLQTHRLRSVFAKEKYIELKELGRKEPLIDLTKSMGHNRVTVLVHYGIKIKK